MANNYLITGYWGQPHVTAENDRGIYAAIFGAGRFVLPVGKLFEWEYIGNNTVRIRDGKLMNNGAAAGIPAGEYIDLLIENTSQGMYRNDIIVFQYSQDSSTLIETGNFVVIKGTETSGTPSDPELVQQDLLSNEATLDQMAMFRVAVSSTTISSPEQLFEIWSNERDKGVELTREMIEAVLTGDISSHTHSAYMPKSGGTFTGKIVAQNNTNYTTKQVRNIFIVPEGDSLPSGANGDICLVYTP